MIYCLVPFWGTVTESLFSKILNNAKLWQANWQWELLHSWKPAVFKIATSYFEGLLSHHRVGSYFVGGMETLRCSPTLNFCFWKNTSGYGNGIKSQFLYHFSPRADIKQWTNSTFSVSVSPSHTVVHRRLLITVFSSLLSQSGGHALSLCLCSDTWVRN